jgi:hypothetical protein
VVAFDVAPSGRVAAVTGRKLSVEGGASPIGIDVGFEALRCRFRGEDLVVLGSRSELLSVAADGTVRGRARVRADARDVAALPGGSVLVSYGPRAGVTLERFGEAPCVFKDAALLDATRLAIESGGVWVLGLASEAPRSRAVRLRPVPEGFRVREVVPLAAPPRAAAVGPDGALYVLLEPGTSVVRIDGGRAGEAALLPGPLHDLARDGRRLLGRGASGIEDLSRLVPKPLHDAALPPLPPCDEP